MRKIFTDTARQEEFMEKGYVKLQLLPADKVDFILQEIKNLEPDDNFVPDDNGMYKPSCHISFVDTNINYKRRTHNFITAQVSPYLENILVGYRVLTSQFFIKPPGKGYLPPHQNWNFISDIDDTTVAVFCPLVDTDETNGTLQVIEGSHKFFPNITSPTLPQYCINIEEEVKSKYSKKISLKAGECIILDDSLLHWSAQNNSDSPRYAMVIGCIPAESTSVVFHFDHNNPDKGFEVFEINSDFFIDYTPFDMLNRPANLKSLGFVENRNRLLSEDEFVGLLKQPDNVFDSAKKDKSPTNLFNKFGTKRIADFLLRLIRK